MCFRSSLVGFGGQTFGFILPFDISLNFDDGAVINSFGLSEHFGAHFLLQNRTEWATSPETFVKSIIENADFGT